MPWIISVGKTIWSLILRTRLPLFGKRGSKDWRIMLFPTNAPLSCRLWKFARDCIVIQIVSVFRLSSSSISDAKYTSHDRLKAINWILIRFLQGHRKLKLPPYRMNLVMVYPINPSFGYTTFRVTKTLKQNYQIDLSKSNFYELIGFDVKIIKDRTNFGPRVPSLSQDNDILNIHCDLVSDSLVDGEESDLIYLFWTSVLRPSLRPCLHGVGDPGLVG